jgi:CheY-like chemotaxis protein
MAATSSNVLVVDGNSDVRKLISVLLQPLGIQPILAKNGRAALMLLDEGLRPALIILDLELPDIEGLDVLDHIRRTKSLNKVPVLILLEAADPQAIREGLNAGADSYVSKPYIPHNLVDRVRVLLAAGRLPNPKTRVVGRTAPLTRPDDNPEAVEEDQSDTL